MYYASQSIIVTIFSVTAALVLSAQSSFAQSADEKMSFFVTSEGSGDGANFGGLEGADAHCSKLAQAAGSQRSWAAYLSASMTIDRSSGSPVVTDGISARNRIGSGPWYNADGVMIAKDVDDLHSENVNISLQTALDENGNQINGRGSQPNKHDILTGTDSNGHFSTAGGDTTCSNWTSNGQGSAIVGHHDRIGLNSSRNMISWNSSHGTAGCGESDLPKTGGAGLLYCFATD